LQLLSFGGMLYPLHAVNLNMLNVQGRSDLFLRLEIIKKILAIPVIVVGVLLGIKAMIVGMIIISMIAFFLNSYYSGQHIGYSSMQQLKDILPSFILAIFIGSITHLIGAFLILPNYLILIIQLIAGGGFFILITELFKMQDYLFVKEIFLDKVLKR
jgi:teichuronic acid exporter